MIKEDLQALPRGQVIIRHFIQAQLLEGGVLWHEEGVSGAGHVRRQVSEVEESRDVGESPVPFEGEERVREELRSEPGERQQRWRFLIPVLLMEPRHHRLAHKEDFADEHDVALWEGRVGFRNDRSVDGPNFISLKQIDNSILDLT